ncbi:porin family protein [candidate division TA06 bacterium]|uniref:Porin family protein n=1 Tax=candidate division TA06 bacterium TaxID=2250710 RepID=A0A933MJX0_UNCT6|nr:porin family protein [candidate division TA06 bacterium]
MENIKGKIVILSVFVLLFMPLNVFASENSNAVSGKLGIYLPHGGEDSYNAIKSGMGFTVCFEHYMNKNTSVMAKAGYLKWGTTEEDEYMSNIPLMAGLKYYLNSGSSVYPYLAADIGLNMWSWMERGEQEYSHQDLGFGLGAGMEIPLSNNNMNLDLSGKYSIISWPSEWCGESFKNIEIGFGIKYALK